MADSAPSEREALKADVEQQQEPSAKAENVVLAQNATEKDVLVLAQSAIKPLEKEVAKWKVPRKKLLLGLVLCSLALAAFWMMTSSRLRKDIGKSNLVTVEGLNRFTVNNLGEVRERLHSKSDMSLYEFLSKHRAANALSVEEHGKNNIVRQVMTDLEHESVQAGMTLIMELFSDLYMAWPKSSFSTKGRKSVRKIIKTLEDEENPVKPEDVEAMKREIVEMKEWGTIDDKTKSKLFETNDPKVLAKTLRLALYVGDCRPYLSKVYEVYISDFKGKPIPEMSLDDGEKKVLGEPEDKSEAKKGSKKHIPSEQALVKATKVLEDLELYVKSKPDLNTLMRAMMLTDLKGR